MARVALDALSLAAFRHNLDSIRDLHGEMVATYHAIMKDIVNTRDQLNPFFMWTRKAKEMGRLVDRFNAVVEALIDPKTVQLKEKQRRVEEEEGDADRRDSLEMMVKLCMALYLMGMHRDVQRKARADVIRALDEDAARRAATCDAAEMVYPTSDQERAFTYLNYVIMETMRLFPSVAKLPRRATTASVTLADGTALPNGTLVLINTFSMHRDPAIWGPDADAFMPDRWAARADADGSIAMHPTAHNYEWAPFGGKQRICLGMQFSLVEPRVILAMMLLRYEWEVVGNENALWGVPDLAPNDFLRSPGIELRLRRRGVEAAAE
ncbi:cytochrome P450-dit2 [Allomyces javanicus]|nr:cytochrome P450-dit2 [Allomyces javanicus]